MHLIIVLGCTKTIKIVVRYFGVVWQQLGLSEGIKNNRRLSGVALQHFQKNIFD